MVVRARGGCQSGKRQAARKGGHLVQRARMAIAVRRVPIAREHHAADRAANACRDAIEMLKAAERIALGLQQQHRARDGGKAGLDRPRAE
jgi:hypothetical protein